LNQSIREQDREWSLKKSEYMALKTEYAALKTEYAALTNQIINLQRAKDERESLLSSMRERFNSIVDQNEQLKPLVSKVDQLEQENLALKDSLNRSMISVGHSKVDRHASQEPLLTSEPFKTNTLPKSLGLKLTIAEVAKILNISEDDLEKSIKRGEIKTKKIGTTIWIPESELR
jgi:excisionase family DNA binding protein